MRTHVALWAAMKTPLLIGSNVKNLTQDDVNVLKNRCLLAFNQDDEYGEPSAAVQMGRQPPPPVDNMIQPTLPSFRLGRQVLDILC